MAGIPFHLIVQSDTVTVLRSNEMLLVSSPPYLQPRLAAILTALQRRTDSKGFQQWIRRSGPVSKIDSRRSHRHRIEIHLRDLARARSSEHKGVLRAPLASGVL
jgi:hypothetical protein